MELYAFLNPYKETINLSCIMKSRIISLIALIVFLPCLAIAQNNRLLDSRKTSEQTYIYKLTEKEAEVLNKKGAKK